jgi:ferric-dicitrate binding protein FerR (iron transport regulator)
MVITQRRTVLLGAASLICIPRIVTGSETAGLVQRSVGKTWAAGTQARALAAKSPVFIGDEVGTGTEARLAMMLGEATRILMGPETTLTIDKYTAEAGGELVLGQGALLFDRDEDAPKTPVKLSTTFGLIAVRGTRFFAGPSKGKYGVFVERGKVWLAGGGYRVTVLPGFGSDIAKPGDPPTTPAKWKQPRIDEAMALVGAD